MSSDEASAAAAKQNSPAPPAKQRQGFSPRWVAVIAGSLLALGTVAVWMIFFSGERLPTIDQARFDAARALWNSQGPKNYDLEVAVTGNEPTVNSVSVRDGTVVSATCNGTPLTQRRTWGAWSVEGMFTTISIDLKHATDPIRVSPNEVNYVIPRGDFDEQYGYPKRYRRIQLGSDNDVSWVVTKFQVVKQ